MPQVKTLEGMASIFGMTPEMLIKGLKAYGILNQNGSPKKKLIDEGYFNSDGTIADYPRLKELISTMLGF